MYYNVFKNSIENAGLKLEHNIDITQDSIFVIGNYIFDFPNSTLIYKNEKINIKEEEAKVLYYFSKNQNKLIHINDIKIPIKREDIFHPFEYKIGIINQLKKHISKDKRIKFEKIQIDRHSYYIKLKCCE